MAANTINGINLNKTQTKLQTHPQQTTPMRDRYFCRTAKFTQMDAIEAKSNL